MSIEVKVPPVGESIQEVTIGNWKKSDGDYVEMDEAICELESEKANFDITAETSGILTIKATSGSTVPIGALIASITESAAPPQADSPIPSPQSPDADSSPEFPQAQNPKTPISSPAALKLLQEENLSPTAIQGTGKGSRITKTDVSQFLRERQNAPSVEEDAAPKVHKQSLSKGLSDASKLEPLAPQGVSASLFQEVDVSALLQLREACAESFLEKYHLKLDLLPFFMKICALALREIPLYALRDSGDKGCDLGFLLLTERGTLAPTLYDVQKMTLAELACGIENLRVKVENLAASVEDLSPAFFLVSDLSESPVKCAALEIDAPRVAGLAFYQILSQALVVHKEISVRPVLCVALSYNAKLVDFAQAAAFLKMVTQLVENPAQGLVYV